MESLDSKQATKKNRYSVLASFYNFGISGRRGSEKTAVLEEVGLE